MSRLTVDRAPTLPDRPAAEWDALLPDSPTGFYLSHRWLTSIRDTKGYRDETWSVRDAVVPVARSPRPVNNALYDLHALYGQDQPAEAWSPQTLVGSRSGYANAALCSDLRAWVAVAEQAARDSGSAAIPYLERDLATAVSDLLPDRPVVLSGARCQVRLPDGDVDGYLARLSRSRRGLVRAEWRAFAASGATIEVGRLEQGMEGVLAPLLANVQHRHGSSVRVEQVAEYLHGCQSHGLRDSTVLITCRHGDQVVGFSLAYEFGSALVVRVVGLDYERVGRHGEYFTLLVHEPVRYALSRGLTVVDLGTEGYRAKVLRGATLVPLWTVLLTAPEVRRDDRVADELRRTCADLVPDLEELVILR
jgi:Acetyltransferase (GNAT) domain